MAPSKVMKLPMTADRRDTQRRRTRLLRAAVWLRRLPRLPTIILGITFLAILIGPAIVPHDPLQPNPANVLEAPSASHWSERTVSVWTFSPG